MGRIRKKMIEEKGIFEGMCTGNVFKITHCLPIFSNLRRGGRHRGRRKRMREISFWVVVEIDNFNRHS